MNTSVNFFKRLVVSIFFAFIAAISANAQASDCTPAASGLVSWWRAEGNGSDSVNGNTAYAALLPGGVTFGPGEVGQGFLLGGTNAYLVTPASASLNIGAGGGLSAEAWINLTDASGYHPILEWNNSARLGGVMLWVLPGGTLFANVVDTDQNSHSFASASGAVSANVFQHVALTYDRSTGIGTLYLNGAVVAQSDLGSFVPETTFNLWFGYRPGDVPGDATYGSYFGGLLDEVSLYNRALGSNEIAAIYNAGASGKCASTNSTTDAPVITSQPTNQTVAAGGNASFTVTAAGSPTLHYDWYGPDNGKIPGANSSTLTLSNVQPSAAGAYYAFVTNSFGFAQSSNAVLTVTGGGSDGGSNACTPPPNGLVGWWKGENNTLDSAGSNNGFTVGGGIPYAPGEVGNAFHYNETNGYIAVPESSSLNVGLGAGLTLEAWIQPADLENQLPIFEWQYNITNNFNGIHFWISSINGPGCLFANLVDSNGTSHWIYSPPGLITADYQHIALTYNKASGVASIYRNGVLVASQPLGSFTPNTTGKLLLGERTFLNWEQQNRYVGNLDEMSVYNRALSQGEIAAIYHAGTAGKCSGANSGTAPVITHQPTNQTVAAGDNATFTVTATGSSPLHYDWYGPDNGKIPGANSSTLTLSNVQPSAAGSYYAFVTNQFGFAVSSNATLTVTGSGPTGPDLIVPNYSASNQVYNPAGSLNQPLRMQMVYGASQFPAHPIIITELRWRPDVNAGGPLSVIVSNLQIKLSTTVATPDHLSTIFTENTGADETVAFSGAASISTAFTTLGNGTKAFDISLPLQTPFAFDPSRGNLLVDLRNLYGCIPARTVQFNIVNCTGMNDAVSRVFSINPNASNAETADTGADVLEIIYTAATNSGSGTAPMITSQPTNQTVAAGGNATFTVEATGSPTLHYDWYGPDNGKIPGANSSTLTLSNVQPSAAGPYYAFVTNQFGFAQSSNAVLSVTIGGSGGDSNTCTPPPSGLAAWWPAEGDGNDIVGHNNAILESGITFAPGKVGQAFQLTNYTNGFMHVPASPSLNVGAGTGMTMEGWINVASVDGLHPIAEWYGNARDTVGVSFWLNSSPFDSGALQAVLFDTNSNRHPVTSPQGILQPNVFEHVAMTYDQASGIANIYLNGVAVAQENIGSFVPQTTADLWIGHRPLDVPGDWTYGATLGGLLDEFTIYNRALSSNEIAAIYNAGANGKCAPTNSGSGTAPMITSQPTNQTVAAGGNVTFTVVATGSLPLHYEWYGPDNFEIPGADSSTLTLSNVQPSAAGPYYAFVTNQFGLAQSSNAVLTVTNATVLSCVSAPTNIAAWWPAESNGDDLIGGATLALHGAATFAPGEVGQAFLLNGSDDYLTSSSNLNVAAGGSLTVEAWVKVSDVSDYHPIVEWNDNSGNAGVHLWILPYSGETPGVLFANIVDTSGSSHSFHSPGGSVSTNGFQHVALTYDNSSGVATLYVNGNIVAQLPLGSFTPQTSFPFWVAHRPNDVPGDATYGAHLGGLLDELSLYGRALSQSEIAAIYHAGANGKCPTSQINQHGAINSQPVVNMSVAGKTSVLSWPVSAGDFTLQSTDDLTPPVHWTNVPATLQTNGNTIDATLPKGGNRGYFRLYHP